jgi:chitinase
MKTNKWTVNRDAAAGVPYARLGRLWVGYDDVTSVALKVRFANQMGLGGAMIWSIETDDFKGVCGQGAFPLLRSIRTQLDADSSFVTTPVPSTEQPDVSTSPPTDQTPQASVPVPTTQSPPSSSQSPNNDEFVCREEGMFRHPNDCTRFIQCVDSGSSAVNGDRYRKFESVCPAGTVFDQKAKVCNWPDMVPECKH